MNDMTVLLIAACAMGGVIAIYSGYIIKSQQRTIDRLNDRLMARDYREYVNTTNPAKHDEKPRRKPMSWHDVPEIEIEEDDVN